MADRLRIPMLARHKSPQFDGITDAKEYIPVGQLSWPLGPIADPIQRPEREGDREQDRDAPRQP